MLCSFNFFRIYLIICEVSLVYFIPLLRVSEVENVQSVGEYGILVGKLCRELSRQCE